MESMIDNQAYEEELNHRWDWLTADIENEEDRSNTNLVLENSYKYMVSDSTLPRYWLENNILNEDADGEETLTEAPQMSNSVGDYVIPKVMFPIIRRVMPELIANKLVSVQPIQAPTGVIYYITYQYSNTKGEITKGDEFSANPQQTTPAFAVYYTSERIGPFAVTAANTTGPLEVTTDKKIVDFLGTDTSAFSIKRFEVYDVTSGAALTATTSTVTYAADTGAITLTADFFTDNTGKITANDVLRVFLVYNQEGSSKIPEMEFVIDHKNVSSTERKLKVRWTKESEQDMMAYHKVNVENELVKVAAVQMNYEIDREVVNFIDDSVISDLSLSHNWTNDAAGTGTATGGNNTHGNYLDRHRALAQKLYKASTRVATYNHLGPADWAVASPAVSAVLQMLPDWKSGEISGNKSTFYNAGSLGNGSIQVYVDPNRTGGSEEQVLMGYKSKDATYGAGVVYSPYANWMSDKVTNPDNFNSIRGFFNRYALTLCPRGQYNYARVDIANIL